ncbi:MAG: CDP-alcohol phosphatidyltransferase family protein [Oscillospiraceae bacterium]|nr:CDP-alcohol phosphatidyltransferase family protein [Oscillospiraceae bacterium]
MIIKDWKKDILTIPNLLSLFRLVLIPIYIVIYLNAQDATDYYIAGGILAVSCLTDAIDGKIARHFNMISTLGKILDPLADKITQLTLVLCLAIRYPVLWILVSLFVVKESFQLVAGFMTLRRGKMLTGALLAGKISTTVLFVSLILLVLMPNLSPVGVNIITAVDCVVLIVAFIGYAKTYYTQSPMIQELENEEAESE